MLKKAFSALALLVIIFTMMAGCASTFAYSPMLKAKADEERAWTTEQVTRWEMEREVVLHAQYKERAQQVIVIEKARGVASISFYIALTLIFASCAIFVMSQVFVHSVRCVQTLSLVPVRQLPRAAILTPHGIADTVTNAITAIEKPQPAQLDQARALAMVQALQQRGFSRRDALELVYSRPALVEVVKHEQV